MSIAITKLANDARKIQLIYPIYTIREKNSILYKWLVEKFRDQMFNPTQQYLIDVDDISRHIPDLPRSFIHSIQIM
jgi:hypothetical protein